MQLIFQEVSGKEWGSQETFIGISVMILDEPTSAIDALQRLRYLTGCSIKQIKEQ
ncbi:hypothetical protein H6801_02920 [Candidatus Nomurabacteria bacterium]|nr:hypothetical protein [Candidatus Nomurabacteria bacterium]